MDLSFNIPVRRHRTVEELLAHAGLPVDAVTGDLRLTVASVAAPEHAVAGSLAFIQDAGAGSGSSLDVCNATVIITNRPAADRSGRCVITVPDPRRWFVAALRSLFPPPPPRISEQATVAPSARIGRDVAIAPHAVIGEDVAIGDGTRIGSHVTVSEGSVIGSRCVIQDHTSVGVSGVAYYRGADTDWYSLPHLGRVHIGDDVEIGAHCVIVRGILHHTVIANGTKLGNLVNVGHNVTIGERCWITSGVVICGRVAIGRDVQIAAGACIKDKISVGDGARIGLGTVVTKSVAAGVALFGVPGQPLRTMRAF